jgi:hypothetical protein
MADERAGRGWWKFDESLADEVASDDFVAGSGVTASYQRFRQFNLDADTLETRYGLLFESGSTYSVDLSGSFVVGSDYTMAMGFWYYSPNAIGRTRHGVTRETTPQMAPIIAKANTTISAGEESVTAGEGEWIVSEIDYSKTQNAIQLAVCGANDDPTDIYISEPYTPGFVHVFITVLFTTTNNYARIDINGKFGEMHTTASNLEAGMANTVAPVTINTVGYGLTSHEIVDEERYISDLVLKANGETNSDQTIKLARFGPNAILLSDSDSTKRTYLGIGYDQPETVTTTQIFGEGGHTFVARSNGEILEGFKPIWSNDFTFSDKNSVSKLTASNTGVPPEWTPGGLRLQGTTIRI